MISFSDHQSIVELVNGIFMYADMHDWVACENSFTPEPYIDYSSMNGLPLAKMKASELIGSWQNFLPRFDFTMHYITNHQVAMHEEHATCLCYGHAVHQLKNAAGGDFWEVYGSYEFAIEMDMAMKKWKVRLMKFNLKYQGGNLQLPLLAMVNPTS